jgi:hypothetical protein
MGVSQI